MAIVGRNATWIGDGATHGGKSTVTGTTYAAVVAASPSPGAACADLSVQISGATVLIPACPQALLGPTLTGGPPPTSPGGFFAVP